MPDIGDTVDVQYADLNQGGGIGQVSGTLGVVIDEAGRVVELAIESDGGVAFVPRNLLLTVRVASL